ncbi:MAG: hypothetical protein A3H45_11000 [Ignavibacteria bacterium RIFCSPLOWO2_02_FULL_55_14]|nr:MAG: hypothetical protein A3C56_07330 [Ignavibacteria bacterium RIFCSPHIGHO2_02_FULL_56_12]OGU74486.1 MAG: hypothetical protein A3H45_11000 [Ignavibacteria bacterium RIFCSPLOWO2_02_FULL_55_14]OGU76254.1 MAG: hypothetical protein A3G43_10890 [Ignavibacteria bacterium RIFCSPLOWO2_12_FULL_56_21]
MNTRFGTYEAFRIIVPGAYAALMLALFHWSFLERWLGSAGSPGQHVALFVFFALSAGITMYARETPKRRRAFAENQPSLHVQHLARSMKGAEPLSDDDARRLYFYLLNMHIPPFMHDKVFFFGTVYHIIVHLRRTTFWFGVVAAASLLIHLASGGVLGDVRGLVLFTVASWLVYVLNVRYNKADRNMQENYQDQILWLEMNRSLVEKLLRDRRTFLKVVE